MDGITSNLLRQMRKYYVLGVREETGLDSVVNNWAYETRDSNTQRLRRVLSEAPIIPSTDSAGKKLEQLTESLGTICPKTLLDFGAGTGDLLGAVSKKYNISKKYSYAIEPKGIPEPHQFTVLQDTTELPDKTIDLVLIQEVLHHIHPTTRVKLLTDIYRIMSPNGIILIKEHAYVEAPAMYIGLDIYHNMWYIRNTEDYDPLYLLSTTDLIKLMNGVGFRLKSKSTPRGWQQIYVSVFNKL